jgi:ElaB/YqjD/DUF883 family membrane-anchored ribosome-binding protein
MTDHYSSRDEMTEPEAKEKTGLAKGAAQLKEKGAELGRRAAEAIDSTRDSLAGTLEGAADKLHHRADDAAEGGRRVTSLAHRAADKLDAAAQYVRDHKTKDMVADLEEVVKAHPGKALLAVLAVGFLAGRALQRDG